MYITNKEFATALLKTGIKSNIIVEALITASKLLKKYGQTAYSEKYKKIIEENSPETGAILAFAKKMKKNKVDILKSTIQRVKDMSDDYHETFVVKTHPDIIQNAAKYITEWHKNAEIDSQQWDEDGIFVSGEGFYYKRSIDADIKKLLGLE